MRDHVTPAPYQLFYNLVTRDALLLHDEKAYPLEGPFQSRDEAEREARELIERLEDEPMTLN